MDTNVQKVDLDEIRRAREALNKELGITTPQTDYNKKKKEVVEETPNFDNEENSSDYENQTDDSEESSMSSEELEELQGLLNLGDDFDHLDNLSNNYEDDDNMMNDEDDFSDYDYEDYEDEDDIDFSVYDNFAPFEVNKEIKSSKPAIKKVVKTPVAPIVSEPENSNDYEDEDYNEELENFVDNSLNSEEEQEQEPEKFKPKSLEEALTNINSIEDLLNMDLDSIELEEEDESDDEVDEKLDSLVDEDVDDYDDLLSNFDDDDEFFNALNKLSNQVDENDNTNNAVTNYVESASDANNNINENVVNVESTPAQSVESIPVQSSATQKINPAPAKTVAKPVTPAQSLSEKAPVTPVVETYNTPVDLGEPKSFNVDRADAKPKTPVAPEIKTVAEKTNVATDNKQKEAHIVFIEKDVKTEEKVEEKPKIEYLKQIDDYNFIDIIKSNEFMECDELTCIYGVDENKNVVCHNFKDFYNTVIFSDNDNEVFKLFSSIMMSLSLKNSNYLIKYVICDAKNGSKFDVYNDLSYMFFSRVAKANSEIIDSLNEIVNEIDKRYENLAKANVKSIEDFNIVMKKANIVPMSHIMLFFNNYTRAIHFDDNGEINSKLHYILKYGRLVGVYVNLVSADENLEDKINYNLQTRFSFKADSKETSVARIGAENAERIGFDNEFVCKTLFSDKVVHLKVPTITQREVELLVKNIEKEEKNEN